MTDTIPYLLISFLNFANDILVPFILAIAFLVFIANIARYFIFESTTKEGKEKARRTATYGIAAFVIIVVLWGIVNFLVAGFGFDQTTPITPDYIEKHR